MVRLAFAFVAAFALVNSARAELPANTPEAAAAEFVAAFNGLDEPRFDAFWSVDATAFFPSERGAGTVRRLDGRDAVLGAFHALFAEIRKTQEGPPYLRIDPKDLRVSRYGDMAVVTFHLLNRDSLGRRTLVMRQEGEAWRIVHLHASALPETR